MISRIRGLIKSRILALRFVRQDRENAVNQAQRVLFIDVFDANGETIGTAPAVLVDEHQARAIIYPMKGMLVFSYGMRMELNGFNIEVVERKPLGLGTGLWTEPPDTLALTVNLLTAEVPK
jgi:hypothetical protein